MATKATPAPEVDDPGVSVAEVALAFVRHAEKHYRKGGKLTSEFAAYRSVVAILTELFGLLPAAEFGPQCLKTCRAKMLERGWVRESANRGVGRIRHVFKFGVEEQLVSSTILADLKCVSGLQAGRTDAVEAEPVRPVSDATIDATLPHLPKIVADMVRVQRLTGMRPGEVCGMLWQEIDTSGPVWLFRPLNHKLSHKNIERVIAIGPSAQALLLTRRKITGPVFPGKRGAFTTAAYRRAITRGCEVAFGVPDDLSIERVTKWRERHCWHPNQIRHQFATELRKTAGLDAVAATLGHSQVTTSQVYAELDMGKAMAVAAKIG